LLQTLSYDSTEDRGPEPRPALSLPESTPTRPTRAALYLRVSTRADKRDDDAAQRKRQEVDNQRRQLRQFCDQQGWEIAEEYIDQESGAKSDRAGFLRMWQDARSAGLLFRR